MRPLSHGKEQVRADQSDGGAAPVAARPAFRGDVEGLRAVAIGLVLLFHASVPYTAGGFVGVDVFFVISGFLITGLLMREVQRTGRIALVDFYARRARRILPSAAFVLLVTLLVGGLTLSGERRHDLGVDALASALQVTNWNFLAVTVDELVPRLDESPLLHYWSLAVEEQFYLVWPLTMIAVVAYAGRRGRDLTRTLVIATVALGALSLVACVLITGSHRLLAYLGSPTRAWQFAAGALLAIGAERIARWALTGAGRRAGMVLGWVGAVLVGSCALWAARVAYPGWAALVPTAGAVAVILAGGLTAQRGSVSWVLSRAPVRFVGRLSFVWYLWHVPATALAVGLTGNHSWPLLLGAELLAVVPAYLTMIYIERPFRYAQAFSATPMRGLALGAVLTGVTCAGALTLVL